VAGADDLAFAAGGSLLVVGGGGKARAFDTSRWREQFSNDADRFAVSVGLEGQFLAMFRNGQGRVRSLTTHEECGSFKTDSGTPAIVELALSADGRHVLGAQSQRLNNWNLNAQHATVAGSGVSDCVSAAMSPHDTWFAISKAGSLFEVYQSDYGFARERPSVRGPTGVVQQLRYSADGSLLAGASADGAVYIWDAESSKLIVSLIGHEQSVNCLAFSPDGKTLASGDDAGVVRLWDLDSRHEALSLKAHSMAVKAVAFSPDGRLLATATAHAPAEGGEVKIWFADSSPQ
jgi:WD40 repeat protein